jgi:hypothetical protein
MVRSALLFVRLRAVQFGHVRNYVDENETRRGEGQEKV